MSDTLINPDLCCIRCGYALKGIPDTGACPECGTRVDESMVARRGPGGELESPRRFVWVARCASLVAIVELVAGAWLYPWRLKGAEWLPFWALDRATAWSSLGVFVVAAMVWTAAIFVARDRGTRVGALVAVAAAVCLAGFVDVVLQQPSEWAPMIVILLPAFTVVGLFGRGQWLRGIVDRWKTRRSARLFAWHAWGMSLLIGCALVSSLVAVAGSEAARQVMAISLGLAAIVQAAAQWSAASQVATWQRFVRRRG